MSRIHVLIADDHAIVRDGLALVIGSEPDMHVVGLVSDGEQAVRWALDRDADVVVLDMRMPKLGGVAAIRALRAQCPGAKILVLSMYADEKLASAALAAGAHGYVGKHASSPELLRAIRAVHQGVRVGDSVEQELGVEAQPGVLSLREREVMELVIAGHTSRAIADQLGITKSSVDTYRARVFLKLGVNDRAELLARVAAQREDEP